MNHSFEIVHQHNKARQGVIHTTHGIIETPAFFFCATKGAIKGISSLKMEALGTQLLLCNTYHLLVNPSDTYIASLGGLHQFIGWNKPIFTDSGGFQIFCLGHGSVANEIKGVRNSNRSLVKITEEGAIFRSYFDGSKKVLTPESTIEIQKNLGADLIVTLDECTPFNVHKKYTELAMQRSHRWEERSLKHFTKICDSTQSLYAVVQGGVYEDLRLQSTEFVNSLPFFGTAIGGSLGSNKEQMHDIVAFTASLLAQTKRPIHLLGIGGISDIIHGVMNGIDTFDCVHPTRLARHGGAIVKKKPKEHINILNASYAKEESPIEHDCKCEVCMTYSRAYIHYLFKARELLGIILLSIHNIYAMNKLMQDIREDIKHGLHNVIGEWLY